MKHAHVMAALRLPGLTAPERLVLANLADRANRDHEAWPSRERICADTGLTAKTVQRALRSLQTRGYLTRGQAWPGRTAVHRLHPDRWTNTRTTDTPS